MEAVACALCVPVDVLEHEELVHGQMCLTVQQQIRWHYISVMDLGTLVLVIAREG